MNIEYKRQCIAHCLLLQLHVALTCIHNSCKLHAISGQALWVLTVALYGTSIYCIAGSFCNHMVLAEYKFGDTSMYNNVPYIAIHV